MTVHFDRNRQRWRYDFWSRGVRYQAYAMVTDSESGQPRPARTKTEAKDAELAEKARVKNKPVAPPAPQIVPGEVSFAQITANYVAKRQGTRNWENVQKYVAELLEWFGPARAANEISNALIWRYINEYSRRQPLMIWMGGSKKTRNSGKPRWKVIDGKFRSDSTTNRYLAALGTILHEAHATREQGKRLLADVPEVPKLDEPDDVPNPVPVRILSSIVRTGPVHLAKAILLTVAFGFRKMEALTVGPGHVDWENRGIRLTSDETKGKRGEFLPADEAQMAMLETFAEEARAAGVPTFVFYVPPAAKGKIAKPRPITNIYRSWSTALEAYGVAGKYRFHDIKASFVSLIGEFASGPVTQGWARHKQFKTTQRYLKLADAPKRAAASALVERLQNAGLSLPSPSPSQKSLTSKKASGE